MDIQKKLSHLEFLNREYALSEAQMLHGEDLSEYRQVFIDAGLDCFI